MSRSPVRGPSGPANALRPSCAGRPAIDQASISSKSPTADGGSTVS